MKKILFVLLLFTIVKTDAQHTLTQYQYWFDQDFANAQIGIQTTDLFSTNIPAASLNVGMHVWHFRTKQNDGKWSSVISQQFFKPVALTSYEYWFDTNYAGRQTINIPSLQIVNVNLLSQTASLNYGVHTIHFHSSDEIGKWGSIISQEFFTASKIDRYEYWFDNDYSAKVMITIPTPVDLLNLNDILAVTTVNGIHHSFHFRAHQENDTWTTTLSQEFEVKNNIVAYEYWFNEDYSSKTNIPVAAISPFELTPFIDASLTALGSNTVHIHFKDANGLWSPVISEGFCHNTGDSSIHLKLLLQGYYTGSGMMASVLLNQGISNDPLVTDSIDVALRNENPPYEVLTSTRVELNTDGTAVCNFPWNFIGSYYLSVKHRNTVETWSSYPIFRGNCPSIYDFTTSDTKAFGNNMTEVENGVWAFYAGDITQDENIDLIDITGVENDINTFQFGYFATDINGDGNVDLLDSPVLEENVNNFIYSVHP